MELTIWMKMSKIQIIWIQMRNNKPLGESRKTGQTSGTKIAFYSFNKSVTLLVCSLLLNRKESLILSKENRI
ncbi:hypothetical protein Hanom_Chr03g00242221 [Helianthus anomalus]